MGKKLRVNLDDATIELIVAYQDKHNISFAKAVNKLIKMTQIGGIYDETEKNHL